MSSSLGEVENEILTWVEPRKASLSPAGHSSTDCRQAGLLGGETRPREPAHRTVATIRGGTDP